MEVNDEPTVGPKPTSTIQWLPDPDEAYGIYARWYGSVWRYTLYWGDGSSVQMNPNSRAEHHIYSEAKTYDVVAVSGVHANYTASAKVTVRDWVTPPTPGSSVTDSRIVTLTMPPVAEPVRWWVQWGDDTSDEYGAGDTPTHTYPWGFGKPEITVTDQPSRRSVTFTGPEIGPEPVTNVPEWTFHHTYLPPQYTDQPDEMRGEFRGRNLRPGVRYRVRLNWSENRDHYATATADQNGRATAVIPGEPSWTVGSGKWYSPWRFCQAFEDANPAGAYSYIPVTSRQDGWSTDGPTVLYMFDPEDPHWVQVQVQKPVIGGLYEIHWGDGTHETYRVGDDGVFCAWHKYPSNRKSAWITINDPDGKAKSVQVGAASITEPYCYRVDDILGSAVRTRISHPEGDRARTPMVVRWRDDGTGGESYSDGIPSAHTYFHPGGDVPPTRWYRKDWWGETTTISVSVPLRRRADYEFTVPSELPPKLRRIDDPPAFPILEDWSPNPFYEQHGLVPHYHPADSWDGGYSGEFVVTNEDQEASKPWLLEFEVPVDAHAAEVWPADKYELTSLGHGRWRVSCDTPIPAYTDARVGVRVEPCGKTKSHPNQMRAREKPSE